MVSESTKQGKRLLNAQNKGRASTMHKTREEAPQCTKNITGSGKEQHASEVRVGEQRDLCILRIHVEDEASTPARETRCVVYQTCPLAKLCV